MALQIAGVMEHADYLYGFAAEAVDEKVPRITDDTRRVACPVAAEEEVIRPQASCQFRAFLRTGPFGFAGDIVNRPLQESPVTGSRALAEPLFAPDQRLVDVPPGSGR